MARTGRSPRHVVRTPLRLRTVLLATAALAAAGSAGERDWREAREAEVDRLDEYAAGRLRELAGVAVHDRGALRHLAGRHGVEHRHQHHRVQEEVEHEADGHHKSQHHRSELEVREAARARVLEEHCREAHRRDDDGSGHRTSVAAIRRCMLALRHYAENTRIQSKASRDANEQYAHDVLAVKHAQSVLAKLIEEQKEHYKILGNFREDQLKSASMLLQHMHDGGDGSSSLMDARGSHRFRHHHRAGAEDEGTGTAEETAQNVARPLSLEDVPVQAGPEAMARHTAEGRFRVLDAVA